jgi:anti-anti-sigma factor
VDFGVVVEHLDGTVFVHLTGELDLATAPELEQVLDDVVARHSGAIMLDLSGLTFVDCAGLRPVHRVCSHVSNVRIVGATPFVHRVLSLTGLEHPMADSNG